MKEEEAREEQESIGVPEESQQNHNSKTK